MHHGYRRRHRMHRRSDLIRCQGGHLRGGVGARGRYHGDAVQGEIAFFAKPFSHRIFCAAPPAPYQQSHHHDVLMHGFGSVLVLATDLA